jgi:hypothetical protein
MAMEQLQQEVKAEHYQIFHLLVQDGRSVNDVSRVVGVRAPRIHLVKFRLSRRLEHLVKQLRKKFE